MAPVAAPAVPTVPIDRPPEAARPPSRPPPPRKRDDDGIVVDRPGRVPAAAERLAPSAPGRRDGISSLFGLTLLSAVDGSLLALAAAGQLETLGGALAVGLLVIAGAGSWLAARVAFSGRRRDGRDWLALAALGAITVASTAAAAWLGQGLAQAMTLHVLPKAAGVVALLVSAEVAGLRLPRLAKGRVSLPFAALAAGVVLEVVAWTA
jgi:hypothetical protein